MSRWTPIIAWCIAIGLLGGVHPAQAATASRLAFVRGGNIWIADSDGGGARQLTFSHKDLGPALSPDGRLVAYFSGVGEDTGYGQIFMIPSQGGVIQQFRAPGILAAEHPAIAPDGGSLLFVGLSDLKVEKARGRDLSYATMSLAISDLRTGAVRQVLRQPHSLLDTGYVYSNPAWAPDGRFIAYQESGSDVSGGFVVINLKGQKVFRFPRNRKAAPYWRPRFAPDGQAILCYSPATSSDKEDLIFLVNLKTGRKTLLALGSRPTFVDGGRAIVFERWPATRWTGVGNVKSDLWRLELSPGAKPRKIVANAEQPAG
ncbi:MAG: hypothetical protein M0P73_15805 [Syntrophobacterales bacterium]|jgi:dipeptidyl aminopeptidase/acylaminoacyl peptidase|nr:hypothetical protein [Syntrophobacterales bacterium]